MKYWPVAVVFLLALSILSTSAAEFNHGASLSSTNFHILDSQHALFGGVASSSSSSFRLLTTMGDLAIGSSSLTSFAVRSGFLYFPTIVAPTLITATAGNGQIGLAWLGADALGGLAIGSYSVCTWSGAYTCQDVASVLSYTKTGLTNGTSYTFKIQAHDSLGNVIAESNELSATPSGGSGGAGNSNTGGSSEEATPTAVPGDIRVTFSGQGEPQTTVILLRDALKIGEVSVNSSEKFTAQDVPRAAGTYKYTFYAINSKGQRSATLSVLVALKAAEQKVLDQLVLPLIEADAPENKKHKKMFDVPGCGLIEQPDLNCDHHMNIVDISVMMFYYKRPLPASMTFMDFNSDGVIDIVDFSILVFHWTG